MAKFNLQEYNKTYVSDVLQKEKEDLPEFRVGDTMIVHSIIEDGNSAASAKRIQKFTGVCIAHSKKNSIGASITIRKVNAILGGVEKTFKLNSPLLDKIEVIRLGKVRRAKLYYLSHRLGAIKIKIRKPKQAQ